MEKMRKKPTVSTLRRKHKRNLFRKGLVGFIAFHPLESVLGRSTLAVTTETKVIIRTRVL